MTYLRARYYDPYQRRFISEDPAKDGVNWYAYCGNNPVMFVDPLGLAPGDRFNSADEAAIDFGIYINDWSIYVDCEYGTYRYSYTVYEEQYGEYGPHEVPMVYYSYADPYTDWIYNEVHHPYAEDIEQNSGYYISVVAYAHTHGGVKNGISTKAVKRYISTDSTYTIVDMASDAEKYSDLDIKSAKKTGLPNYLVTPTGKLKVYEQVYILFVPIYWREREISTYMPHDPILDWIGYFN